jgi:hypothetical protein
MAGKKSGARKSAAKKDKAPAAPKTPKEPKAPKAPAQPTDADRKKQAELATPLEGVGPGVEHEDHEGGITDSLARKGVRGPLPTAEEREELEADQPEGIRAPSVRDRQTGMSAAIARGGNPQRGRPEVDKDGNRVATPRGAAAILAARPGARIIPVVATRLGQYPADGRLRAPGEAFDYVMGEKEEKLPSWMQDARGELESREVDETSPQFDETPAAVITVGKDGSVTSRNATVTEQNKVTGSKASVI